IQELLRPDWFPEVHRVAVSGQRTGPPAPFERTHEDHGGLAPRLSPHEKLAELDFLDLGNALVDQDEIRPECFECIQPGGRVPADADAGPGRLQDLRKL